MERLLSAMRKARGEYAREDRPFVTAAWAQSLDGCLSRRRGRPTALSSPESLRFTHALRAEHDAVLVGIETVLGDNPLLTVRLVDGTNPRRVVLDSQLRIPLDARLLREADESAWLVAAQGAETPQRHRLEAAGARVLDARPCEQGVCIGDALSMLYACGIRTVMVEGGARVLASFFREGAVDLMFVTVCPRMLGNPDAVRLHVPASLEPGQLIGRWGIPSGADWIVSARVSDGELVPLTDPAVDREVAFG